MIKGVIFDVDGTMLDSMCIWRDLGIRYLKSVGVEAEDSIADILYPMSLEESSSYLKERFHLPDTVERIKVDTLRLIENFYLNEVAVKEGLIDYLGYLNENNIPMIIATSSDADLIRRTLERMKISHFFKGILTCTELGTSKREPYIYLKASQFIDTDPRETVVFEDVLHGIRAASSAGFITVAVADPSNKPDRDELKKLSDYFIEDFSDSILRTI